jgi:hypothetical protein
MKSEVLEEINELVKKTKRNSILINSSERKVSDHFELFPQGFSLENLDSTTNEKSSSDEESSIKDKNSESVHEILKHIPDRASVKYNQ